MAKPAWKIPWIAPELDDEPDLHDEDPGDDQREGVVGLQRVIERPDGSLELVELPLTPELYLNPRLEDKMTQGELHADVMAVFKELLGRHFASQRDVKVLMDVKHLFGRRMYAPSPDVSIVRGVRNPEKKRNSFNVITEGVIPCLVIEIVSPIDARVRRMDEEHKFKFYQRVGIPEYLMIDPPRRSTEYRFRIKGYRLDPDKRYQPIAPDAQGRLLSETTTLWFGVSPDGKQIEVFDVGTGERLRTPQEEVAGRQVAEEKADRESMAREAAEGRAARESMAREAAEGRAARESTAREAAEERAAREATARKAAEEELERLRAEIEKLKSGR